MKKIINISGKEYSMKASAFENIKAQVGNSSIIGIGLGRGGQGAGSRAGLEEVSDSNNTSKATRSFTNASYSSTDHKQILEEKENVESGNYNNVPIEPSEMNFKGGDGAVIITW